MNEYLTISLLLISFFLLFYIKERLSIFISKLKIKYKLSSFLSDDESGFVYIVSNRAFKEGTYKIGMTNREDYRKRIGELFNTSVPYPFDVEYIFKTSDADKLEKELHRFFSNKRMNSRREFFKMDKMFLKRELKELRLIS